MSKIRQSARGQDCTIRIPGVCLHDPEKVVLCHDSGGGMGTKMPDSEAAFGCSACHDAVDFRGVRFSDDDIHIGIKQRDGAWGWWRKDDLRIMFFEGQRRTRIILIEKGLLICK